MYSLIGMPQGAEWLVILAIVVLVFGAAKLPDLARGTGQALRIFKAETKGLKDDDETPEQPTPPAELPPASQPTVHPTVQPTVQPTVADETTAPERRGDTSSS